MSTIFRSPTIKNCQRKSTYLFASEVAKIKSGHIKTVVVSDELEKKTFELPAIDCVEALLDSVYHGASDTYQCFNYGVLLDLLNKTKLRPEYWTQDKVATFFNVPANYICDLHKFNFLQPSAKDGRALLYLKEDVLAAAAEARVQLWQKYCQGGRSIMKGE